MKRPLAYVTAAWRGGECEVMEQAAKYCRIVYDAGYSPICPMLYLPLFLNDAVPEEHKSGIDMGRDLLRRSRVLVSGRWLHGAEHGAPRPETDVKSHRAQAGQPCDNERFIEVRQELLADRLPD